MEDLAATFVGDIPSQYDGGLGPVLFQDFAAMIAARVAAYDPAHVLEIAAGTGIVTRALRDRLPSGSTILATDLNAPMLAVAEARFARHEGVTFQTADAVALPFPAASFDAVVCQFGLMFFPDKQRAHAEARRVLKGGGHYVFSVWDSHGVNAFGRHTHEILERFFPIDPPPFYRVPFGDHLIDPIRASLAKAGFAKLDVSVLPLRKLVADRRSFARGLVFGNPLVDQIRARGGVDPEAVVEAVDEMLAREFGASPTVVPLQTILFACSAPVSVP